MKIRKSESPDLIKQFDIFKNNILKRGIWILIVINGRYPFH